MKKCTTCQKDVYRFPSQSKRSKSGNIFCSRSCTATFNNTHSPKRKLKKACKKCKELIKSDYTYCKNCFKYIFNKSYLMNKTLEEATHNRKDNNRYCNIRSLSRRLYMRSDRPKFCEVCGYDKHIEICHIMDIAKFPKDTLISEVNDLDNLLALCPNHHWELDNGLIKVRGVGHDPTTSKL